MADAQKETGPKRILIVDDERSMQRLVIRILKSAGFETDGASDGKQALDILNTSHFDLVVTDISMPVMDGLALTEKVTQSFSADVIIMTGRIDEYSYDQMINLGASDYIQKPFNPEEMLLRVKRVIKERHLKKETIRLTEEKAQSQRLEAIGQLAAGIAHEINTPIQYIGDNTTFIQESFQDLNKLIQALLTLFKAAGENRIDKDILTSIKAVVEETDFDFVNDELPVAITQTLEGVSRIKEIIKAMKDFSHPGGGGHVLSNLNHCIKSTVSISKNEWKYIADLDLDLDENLPEIQCNPGELNQVFLNLIINAGHAISDRLGDHASTKGNIKITTRRKDNQIQIFISDNGSGIPDDIRTKIFDPFFTTKGIGKGTGQGLAISRSIVVNHHKGKIDIDTEENKGTTFIITLPVADKEMP